MPLVVKDRVLETSTTTGTGSFTLSGAAVGYQTFSSAIGNTNTTYYTIDGGAQWEVGIGTVSAGALSRDTVLESSNAGALVNFSAGAKSVFCTYPAERSVATDVPNTFTANQIISVTDNTNAALRITQLGTGNAILVEDNTNPDSSPFVVDANGNVGVGTTTPTTKLSVYDNTNPAVVSAIGDGVPANFRASRYSTDATGPVNGFFKYRGTFASPTAVASGDSMGAINFNAYGGTNTRNIAQIASAVGTYTSDTDISSVLTFSTAPTGGTTLTERLRITAAGGVSFGSSGTAYGTSGQVLQSNGDAPPTWGTAPTYSNVQTFTSSGTWTKPSNGSYALIKVWGAGGGGGRRGENDDASGGGGGGYTELLCPLSSLSSTATVTIGAGGAGRSTSGNGTNGGNSTFVSGGITVTGYAGGGGGNNTVLTYGGGGGGALSAGGVGGTSIPVRGTPIYGFWSGGDGGASRSNALGDNRSCVFGGAGGGGRDGTADTTYNAGGTSLYGGNGGAAARNATAGNGVQPGGGGGGSVGGISGNGADGEIEVYVW